MKKDVSINPTLTRDLRLAESAMGKRVEPVAVRGLSVGGVITRLFESWTHWESKYNPFWNLSDLIPMARVREVYGCFVGWQEPVVGGLPVNDLCLFGLKTYYPDSGFETLNNIAFWPNREFPVSDPVTGKYAYLEQAETGFEIPIVSATTFSVVALEWPGSNDFLLEGSDIPLGGRISGVMIRPAAAFKSAPVNTGALLGMWTLHVPAEVCDRWYASSFQPLDTEGDPYAKVGLRPRGIYE